MIPAILGLCGAFCGPCMTYGNAENLGESGILYCLLWFLCTPCLPTLLLRQKVRERHRINVSVFFQKNFIQFH